MCVYIYIHITHTHTHTHIHPIGSVSPRTLTCTAAQTITAVFMRSQGRKLVSIKHLTGTQGWGREERMKLGFRTRGGTLAGRACEGVPGADLSSKEVGRECHSLLNNVKEKAAPEGGSVAGPVRSLL